jgi:hypothetical protein
MVISARWRCVQLVYVLGRFAQNSSVWNFFAPDISLAISEAATR